MISHTQLGRRIGQSGERQIPHHTNAEEAGRIGYYQAEREEIRRKPEAQSMSSLPISRPAGQTAAARHDRRFVSHSLL